MSRSFPIWVAGEPVSGTEPVEVRSPYDETLAGTTGHATPAQIERAVATAYEAAGEVAGLPAYVRADALGHVSRRLAERADEVADLITAESGKPIRWARAEVARAVATFRWGAEEARRYHGDLQRLDTDPAGAGRVALTQRVPRGPVLGITPFNFPLNLVAHKVAPALAAGCPIVVKPAPATPLTALVLGELLAETDLPAGAWSVLPLPNQAAAPLVSDPRLPVVSFTGSGPVGWSIRDQVPRKTVLLELGGNAAALVCPDWSDLTGAAQRIATFAMYQAGQSCIAVQRVYAHRDVYPELIQEIERCVRALRTGDPADPATEVGPLINEAAARRVQSWVEDAVTAGATVLTGGGRDGARMDPTVLADAPESAPVNAEEVFGPVLTVAPVDSVTEALERVNDSRYGLQAGVFTNDLRIAFDAATRLRVGGVIIGDVPSYRADQLPYGGTKDSGTGREGIRPAMDEFTETRVLVLPGLDRCR